MARTFQCPARTLSDSEAAVSLQDLIDHTGGHVIGELQRDGVLNGDRLEQIHNNPVFLAQLEDFLRRLLTSMVNLVFGCLRLISAASSLELHSTSGEESTIAESQELFKGYLDPNFERYGLDVKSSPTNFQQAQVFELVKGGNFEKIYGGLGDDLSKMCLTQPQIIQFIQRYFDWLRTEGYGTYFLFKAGEKYYVALVYISQSKLLGVRVKPFLDKFAWQSKFRQRFVVPLVIPQVVPANPALSS